MKEHNIKHGRFLLKSKSFHLRSRFQRAREGCVVVGVGVDCCWCWVWLLVLVLGVVVGVGVFCCVVVVSCGCCGSCWWCGHWFEHFAQDPPSAGLPLRRTPSTLCRSAQSYPSLLGAQNLTFSISLRFLFTILM